MSEIKTFPANKREALALLYVQSQELTGVTPVGLLELYNSALDEISVADRAAKESKASKLDF